MIVIGGGSNSSGGETSPNKDKIVLTGEDLSGQGYASLETDLVLHKDNEPELHAIYFEAAGQFIEVDTNLYQLNNYIYKIAEQPDLFMRMDKSGIITFFREFDGSDYVDSASLYPSLNYNDYVGVIGDSLIFEEAEILYWITFDNSLSTTAEVAASVTMKTLDLNALSDSVWGGLPVGKVWFTKKGVYLANSSSAWAENLAFVQLDENFEDDTFVTFKDISGYTTLVDPANEHYITMNGALLSHGVLYDIENGSFIGIIGSADHEEYIMVFHYKGKDHISYRAVEVLGILDEDLNLETVNTPERVSDYDMIGQYENENNYSMFYQGGSVSNFYHKGFVKDGVFTTEPRRKAGFNWYAGTQIQNLFDEGGYIGQDRTDTSISYYTKFVTDIPDIFTIEAHPSQSKDKQYWIKLQEKGGYTGDYSE